MIIEGVTVSVDYADFLAHTIPLNRALFDRWIVVTDSQDQRTRDLCEHHHIECVSTDAFYANGRAFVKSAGINTGLRRLSQRGWVVQVDADIVLPPRARQLIGRAELDPASIYGCDRMLCNTYDDWCCYVSAPEVQHSCNTFIQANDFPLGPRVGKLADDGWMPIGFFQMWNPGVSGISKYPDHGECDRSDMIFARQWPRGKRHLIPEMVAIHLESEPSDGMGVNWRGRRTPHFGPCPPRWRHRHRHHHHHHSYCDPK